MEQRSEAYKNYVSDSLFFIQHLFTDPEKDEDHGNMFRLKIGEILQQAEESNIKTKEETPEDIINRMVNKSIALSGEKI